MLERVEDESFWLGSPSLADELVRGEALEGLQPPAEIVGIDEVGEVPLELCVAVVVIALNGRLLDGAVHSLDLAVGPWMADLGAPMFDAIFAAAHGEHVCDEASSWTIGIARRQAELDAVVGQDGVDPVALP